MQVYRSSGKILLTAEYIVLKGAKALALPTKKGQELEVESAAAGLLDWKSLDENGKTWFDCKFMISQGEFDPVHDQEKQKDAEFRNTALRLQQILSSVYKLNHSAFNDNQGYSVKTRLDFNRKWGLGTSSTLINNLAQWLDVNPYELLEMSFGGSGYDIAAAMHNNPITYQLGQAEPAVFSAAFDPVFKEQLFFVFLNRKQNSRDAIAHFKKQPQENLKVLSEKISGITEQIISCQHLEEFRMLMEAHETLISEAINLPKIKTQLFPDYPGLVKSLGGWGGDFVLATGEDPEKTYFKEKGYSTILDYTELIA
ncbi:GYDIA family GHMP kinase [Christiangramia salexigens]|uniref:GHMP kinase n=1 Tax=Christiangramia salexigens TaxID=1913577 RepID=A0A1L3J7G2_9FLAO|nr:GYDIA family GHMP kinase [Christiangramia salexigens]APG61058.1 GHMP kinase [Christiangramia salexigens]